MLVKQHPDTLKSMRYWALALNSRGKYEDLDERDRQTLELQQKVLGKEHLEQTGQIQGGQGAALMNIAWR